MSSFEPLFLKVFHWANFFHFLLFSFLGYAAHRVFFIVPVYLILIYINAFNKVPYELGWGPFVDLIKKYVIACLIVFVLYLLGR